tara:strand:- start:143 stop:559 length:417 start_codon:yes stop_codon:yes gene_type:complete
MSLRRTADAPKVLSVFDYPPDQPLVHVPRGAPISGLSEEEKRAVTTSEPTPRPFNAEGIIEWQKGERFWAMVSVGRSALPTKAIGEVDYRRALQNNGGGGLYRVKWNNKLITDNTIYAFEMYDMDSYNSYDYDGNPVS